MNAGHEAFLPPLLIKMEAYMSQKKILLIDDSKVIRRSIKQLLEKNNMQVFELSAVEELFTTMETFRDVNLILLDIDLPGMDGLTALEYIRGLSAINHIPVMIISGHSEVSIIKRAASLNIAGYVCKPYIAKQLLERITNILSLESTPNSTDASNK